MPLLYFLAELWIFILFVDWLGFWWSVLAYILPSILGVILLSMQSREVMTKLQKTTAGEQNDSSSDILRSAGPIIGALFLIIPGFFSRAVGVLLIFPPTRWLLIFLSSFLFFRRWISKSFSMYQFGSGAFHVYTNAGRFKNDQAGSEELRDVKESNEVIDVVPIKIENKRD